MKRGLSPAQIRSILGSSQHLNIWHGAIRSGKTLASTLAWLGFIESGPPGKLMMIGKTLDTLERNVLDPMSEFFPARLRDDAVQHTRGATTATVLGRLVHLVGANDSKAEGRIRGVTLAGTYVDEASLVPEDFWQMLLGRLSVPGARLFATTNPDSPNHWLKSGFIDRADELDLSVWHHRLRDNPSLDTRFLRNLAAEYTGLWRLRFIEGLWVLAEGAIYGDCWDPDRHVVDELPRMTRWWAAVDYGTTNPFVMLLFGLGVDGRLYVTAEWRWDSLERMRQKTDIEYVQDTRAWLLKLERWPEYTFAPPEEPNYRLTAYREGWKGMREADNSVVEGIRLVASLLSQDRLRVHRSCEGLIEEFPGYVWDPKAQMLGVDEPVKVDDHSLDALRYGVLSAEGIWRRAPFPVAA